MLIVKTNTFSFLRCLVFILLFGIVAYVKVTIFILEKKKEREKTSQYFKLQVIASNILTIYSISFLSLPSFYLFILLNDINVIMNLYDSQVLCVFVFQSFVLKNVFELLNSLDVQDTARNILKNAPGVVVIDDRESNNFPTPLEVSNKDNVAVGRIRRDVSQDGDYG